MNQTFARTGAAPSDFAQHLVAPDSELAQQVAKDPFSFEFLGLTGDVAERDLEHALMDRITETLRELGPGFAFVGRQVHFDVGGDDFYIDLVDDRLRRDVHADTVGILICGSRNDHTVRYSLTRATSPMAVATYTFDSLPAHLQHEVPSAARLITALEWAETVEGDEPDE